MQHSISFSQVTSFFLQQIGSFASGDFEHRRDASCMITISSDLALVRRHYFATVCFGTATSNGSARLRTSLMLNTQIVMCQWCWEWHAKRIPCPCRPCHRSNERRYRSILIGPGSIAPSNKRDRPSARRIRRNDRGRVLFTLQQSLLLEQVSPTLEHTGHCRTIRTAVQATCCVFRVHFCGRLSRP